MSNKDYYKTLGVQKNATQDEIKKAFRKLAHEYHPDKKTGNEAKFKEINEAYTILSDEKKRAQYDQFGSGFQGFQGGANQGGFDFSGFDFSGFSGGFNGFKNAGFDIDLDDILGSIFGGGRGFSRMKKGQDVQVDVEISFDDSIVGTKKDIQFSLKNHQIEKVSVDVPAGIESGEMIRFREKGEPSKYEGGARGDLYVRIFYKPHKFIRKEGANLIMEKEITLTQAITGSDFDIEIVNKKINIKIPAGINNGEFLRAKGKGIKMKNGLAGDLLVKIKIKMPSKLSPKAKEAIEILKKEGI